MDTLTRKLWLINKLIRATKDDSNVPESKLLTICKFVIILDIIDDEDFDVMVSDIEDKRYYHIMQYGVEQMHTIIPLSSVNELEAALKNGKIKKEKIRKITLDYLTRFDKFTSTDML